MLRSICLISLLAFLVACSSNKQESAAAEKKVELPYRNASASEVFTLRSKCADLARKMQDEDVHGPAVTTDVTSHYNSTTNRCYVQLNVSAIDTAQYSQQHLSYLFDGQTHDLLVSAGIDHGKPANIIFIDPSTSPDRNEKSLPLSEQAVDLINYLMADYRKS